LPMSVKSVACPPAVALKRKAGNPRFLIMGTSSFVSGIDGETQNGQN
jgi:hypothetical protein